MPAVLGVEVVFALTGRWKSSQGMINLNGGNGNADGAPGYPGTLFIGKKSPTAIEPLSIQSGTLVFDTGGAWYDNQGNGGTGQLSSHYIENGGLRYGYSVCRFDFSSLSIGSDVVVEIRGENALKSSC